MSAEPEKSIHELWLDRYRDEGGEFKFCDHCGETPCSFALVGDKVIAIGRTQFTPGAVPNSIVRKSCYKAYIYLSYGHMGKGNRERIPNCVLAEIRKQWPDEEESYMGHHDS